MIRALLTGTKTQTRRIVKPQPPGHVKSAGVIFSASASNGQWSWLDAQDLEEAGFVGEDFRCPYGVTGDLLWVRETWGEFRRQPGIPVYRADDHHALGASNPWRPSIHMPRRYSRITLRITNVRVERLQELTEADAVAEGIERISDPRGDGWKSYELIHEGRHKGKPHPHAAVPNRSPVTSYRELWESINGANSWAANPWVWALSFELVQP